MYRSKLPAKQRLSFGRRQGDGMLKLAEQLGRGRVQEPKWVQKSKMICTD